MPPLYLLIKPASGLCNMRCCYCFYANVAANRVVRSYGIMSIETLEALLRNVFTQEASEYTLAFQGGEPTLAGLGYFRELVRLVGRYNTRRVPIHYALQTNGYLMDNE